MLNPVWVAAVVGLAAGVFLSYGVGSFMLPRLLVRSRDMLFAVRMAFAGTAIALVPAFLLAWTVGGTLGGAWAERFLGRAAVPLGLGVGIALVFAVVLLAGGAIGALLGRILR